MFTVFHVQNFNFGTYQIDMRWKYVKIFDLGRMNGLLGWNSINKTFVNCKFKRTDVNAQTRSRTGRGRA